MASGSLVYGVGKGSGKLPLPVEHRTAYKVWHHMLERCYAPGIHKKHPTYADVTVAPEWLDFSAFALWYAANYRPNCVLDKDLKFIGNKEYSPNTCVFVPQWLNNLLIDSGSSRGELPIGVSRDRGRFKARFSCRGVSQYLGGYSSVIEAKRAYLIAKANHILKVLHDVAVPAEVKNSLWLTAQHMKSEEIQWV